jgi:magnesium transporter
MQSYHAIGWITYLCNDTKAHHGPRPCAYLLVFTFGISAGFLWILSSVRSPSGRIFCSIVFMRSHIVFYSFSTMSSPTSDQPMPSSPKLINYERDGSPTRYRSSSLDSDPAATARMSPTLSRSYNPMDPDARERQRTLDVDMAMHLSRARHESFSVSPVASPLTMREHDDREPPETHPHHEESTFPTLFLQEERELGFARGEDPRQVHNGDPYRGVLAPDDLRQDLGMPRHLTPIHEPHHLLDTLHNAVHQFDGPLPLYQPPILQGRQTFNFGAMEEFAKVEKTQLGLASSPFDERLPHLRVRKPSQVSADGEVGGSGTEFRLPAPRNLRERKLSQSNAVPRRHGGGKMALFEGAPGAPPASLAVGIAPPLSVVPSFADLPTATGGAVGHDRPYRFSFYSNALSATIHARSLCELPADGQSFEDMFAGVGGSAPTDSEPRPVPLSRQSTATTPFVRTPRNDTLVGNGGGDVYKNLVPTDLEGHTWWLDVLSPTDDEMKMLSKVCHTFVRFSRTTNCVRTGLWHSPADSGRYPDGRSARED